MSSLLYHYPESRFGGFTDVDGTMRFYLRVNALIDPESVVLDVGCGRGEYMEDSVRLRRELRILKGKCKRVIGIDVDEGAAENPFVDEFHQIEGPRWPIENASIDVLVCDYVVEHIDDAEAFFAEMARVIRSGGYLCIRTPNLWGYVAICSRLVPNSLHSKVLHKVQSQRKEEDVFPTLYRCNTPRKIRKMFEKHGFIGCAYGVDGEPAYFSFSGALYYLAKWYHKLSPKFLKTAILAYATKQT